MAKTVVIYAGGNTEYQFPFDYLRKEFVKVSLVAANGTSTDKVYGSDYTVTDRKITLKVASDATGNVRIWRSTTTKPITVFSDASVLRARTLNALDTQLLHIAEENSDAISMYGMSFDKADNTWQGMGRIIKNVKNPLNPQDAVTLNYLDSVGVARGTQMEALAAQITADKSNSEALAAQITADKSNSEVAAAAALVSERNAKTSETNAKVSETASKNSETNAKVSETASKTSETNAKTSEENSKTSETNAAASQSAAAGSQVAAANSAAAAQSSADTANTYVGAVNCILRGLKISAVNGFSVSVDSGVVLANEVRKVIAAGSITMSARKAALIYADNTGALGKVDAKYPTDYIDNNTIGMWIFNKDAGENVHNLAVGKSAIAVANDLISVGGIMSVDGRCDIASKLDGTTGYFTSQNSTGLPIGASAREVNILWTCKNSAATECIASYGGTAGSALMLLTSGGKFVLSNGSTTILDSGFVVENEADYYITFKYESGVMTIYVGGKLIASVSVTLTTVAGILYVGKASVGTAYYTSGIIHFVSIRNALKSDVVTSEISNKLVIPCFYMAIDGKRHSIIDDVVPANAVAVAFARTSGTVVLEYNDLWPMYGRREGATGGNRKMFLPWQSFSGAQTLRWTNPFGTGKYKVEYHWSSDAKGSNEIRCHEYFENAGGTGYGMFRTAANMGYNDAWSINTKPGTGGAALLDNLWKTSGYICGYAEMLEDYTGVV